MTTASPVNLRNLEQIHEGSAGRSSRLATFFLGATGLAAVLVAGVLLREREGATTPPAVDPLTALVAQAEVKESPDQLKASELDFPDLLTDGDRPTTALVAVRDEKGRLLEASAPDDSVPDDVEGLPKEPLPAGMQLTATTVTTQPRDELARLAVSASQVAADGPMAEPGMDSGYTIQVASFKSQEDADRFVEDLRRRDHRAFRQAANVPGRGLWHRVRIGPFTNKYQAELYKDKLEEKERVTALVIDPEKVERAEQVRAAKLAERIRKYGSP